MNQDHFRPEYHFTVPNGWINDPNGLVWYQGKYHVFAQHNPHRPVWGPMHWAHATSDDLIHWEHQPIALYPDQPYDTHDYNGGCFSGSAIDDNGILKIIYTGCVTGQSPSQCQCVAESSDGVNFIKSSYNPVIKPPIISTEHFRDPKIWKHEDKFYVIIGSQSEDYKGQAITYCSQDMTNWQLVGVTAKSEGSLGDIWECPDMFVLGDKYILMFSPIHCPYSRTMYLHGDFDYNTGKMTINQFRQLDYGRDLYAPQSFLDPKGRRILIGWLTVWGDIVPTAPHGWAGCFSIPRELSVDETGELIQKPIEELCSIRGQKYVFKKSVNGENPLGVEGDSLELLVTVNLKESCADQIGLIVRCNSDRSEKTVITYDRHTGLLTADASCSGQGHKPVDSAPIGICEELTLHIFIDKISVEIFALDGKRVITQCIYPSESSKGIYAFSKGDSTKFVVTTYELKK